MEKTNPYQSPRSEITPPSDGFDTTSPFSPSGRFGRLSYLAWGLLATIVMYAVMLLLVVLGVVAQSAVDGSDPLALYQSIPILIVYVAMMVLFIMFAIRRLHDFDFSGWWMLLMLVPIANIVLGLMLIFRSGTEGANRFAPPRVTPGWERIVGIIAAVLMGLSIALAVIAVIGAAFVANQQMPIQ